MVRRKFHPDYKKEESSHEVVCSECGGWTWWKWQHHEHRTCPWCGTGNSLINKGGGRARDTTPIEYLQPARHYRRRITIEELAKKGKAGEEWVVYEIQDRLTDDSGGYFRKLGAWNRAAYYNPDPEIAPDSSQAFDRNGRPIAHPSMFTEHFIAPESNAIIYRGIKKAIRGWNPEGGRRFKTFAFEAVRREFKAVVDSYKPVRLMNMNDLQEFTGLDDPAETSILEDHDTGEASEGLRRYIALCLRLEGRTISKALAAKVVGVARQSIYDFNKKLAADFTLFPTSNRGAEKEPLLPKRNPDITTKRFPQGIIDLTPYNAVQRMNDPDWTPRLR